MQGLLFLTISLVKCVLQPGGTGALLGQYSPMDSLKHKFYFGHSLERCEQTPGEFSDYDAYSLGDKNEIGNG